MLTFEQVLLLVGFIVFSMIGFMIAQSVRNMRLSQQKLEESMRQIALSKRLSTYLVLERKNGLPISPEQFEANRSVLEARMLAELEEQIRRSNARNNPGYASWEILGNRTGYDSFVTTEVKLATHTALTRLFTNNDLDGARQFICDVVAAL